MIRTSVGHTGPCSWFSALQAEELEVADQQADEITLRIRNVFRYGIQIITNVAGSGTPSLVFENPAIRDAETNALTFEVSVRNTGDLWINPQLWIDLYGGRSTCGSL